MGINQKLTPHGSKSPLKQNASIFLETCVSWAEARSDVLACLLVGSYARGTAQPGSDIDMVILTDEKQRYLEDISWIEHFGIIEHYQVEEYGLLTSVRTWYKNGLEVEFGISDQRWASIPLDTGSRQVLEDGYQILFERGQIISRHKI